MLYGITLEINDDAIKIAKDVFKKHSPKYDDHYLFIPI